MKRLIALLLCTPIVVMAAGCATLTGGDGNAWDDLHVTDNVSLVVHGLSCPLCASNLDTQLLRVEGVTDMWVDLDTGHVNIEIEQGVSVAAADLARAVRNAGFTLHDVQQQETTE